MMGLLEFNVNSAIFQLYRDMYVLTQWLLSKANGDWIYRGKSYGKERKSSSADTCNVNLRTIR